MNSPLEPWGRPKCPSYTPKHDSPANRPDAQKLRSAQALADAGPVTEPAGPEQLKTDKGTVPEDIYRKSDTSKDEAGPNELKFGM